MSNNVYLYHLLLFSGRMLKFQSLEVNNNKCSSDFRHTNFFSFDAVGGACLSGLVCPVEMSHSVSKVGGA